MEMEKIMLLIREAAHTALLAIHSELSQLYGMFESAGRDLKRIFDANKRNLCSYD